MTEHEIALTLASVSPASVHETLAALERNREVEGVDREGATYYRRAR